MILRKLFSLLLLLTALSSPALARVEIELNLTRQRAYLIEDGNIIEESPISSGRPAHPTPTGHFRVTEKDIDHRSSLYGKVVNSRGNVVKSDADHTSPVPKGGRFVRAPMRYFLRFNGAIGMHAGILPGYPASHGCVRLPSSKAALFYEMADVGTPVRVYRGSGGRAETRRRPEPRMEERRYIEREPHPFRRGPTFFRRLY
jgi:lipoprotein-anchoring transpeptidase ErfK/SrfK